MAGESESLRRIATAQPGGRSAVAAVQLGGGSAVAAIQPGGRAAAPGELALVQAFINTFYDLEVEHGAEVFATPEKLALWLLRHGLLEPDTALRSADVRRAIAVREGLRSLARDHPEPARLELLNQAARGAVVEIQFAAEGPRFIAGATGGLDSALGAVLAITAKAMIDGSWARLKICPGEDCGWAFYDHSRNQSGRWCSMNVCGGRAKARAYYQRRRGGEA